MPLDQTPYQCKRAGFLCPKCDDFACLHTLHLKRRFFLPQSVASPLSQHCSSVYTTKLIICQIRYELSVIIHEIRTSWTKMLNVNTMWIFICLFQINSVKLLKIYYWNKFSANFRFFNLDFLDAWTLTSSSNSKAIMFAFSMLMKYICYVLLFLLALLSLMLVIK